MLRIKHRPLQAMMLVLTLVTFPALAGLGYTVKTTVERADGTKHFGEQVLTEGNQARIDFLDANGKPDGSYLVTNNGGKTFALADGSEAYCSDWKTASFFRAAGQFLNKGARLANAKLKSMSVEKILEEPGGRLEGHDTTHIRLVTKYGATARILFLTFEYEVEEIDDIWMANDLELPVFERLWLDSVSQTGFDYLDEIYAQRMAFETAPVLKLENVVTLRNVKKGEEEVKKETILVSNLRELTATDIDPGHFKIPRCQPVSKKVMEKEATRMLKKHIR